MKSVYVGRFFLCGFCNFMVGKLLFIFMVVGRITLCPIMCRCSGYDLKINCMHRNISTSEILKILPSIQKDLRYLELSGNLIEEFPIEHFKDFKKLEYIGLSNNKIDKLPPEPSTYVPKLKSIFLNGNNIEELSQHDFIGYENLEIISLSKNHIRNISDFSFQRLVRLKQLFLNGNYITKITRNTFYGLKNLHQLLLNNNQLRNLQEEAFSHTPLLAELFLHSNNLQSVPAKMISELRSLEILTLNSNKITHIHPTAFQNASIRLREIFLNENQLSELPLQALSQAKDAEVHLTNNPIVCSCVLTMSIITNPNLLKRIFISGDCLKSLKPTYKHFLNSLSYRNCSMCDLAPCKSGSECKPGQNSLKFSCIDIKDIQPIQIKVKEHNNQSIKIFKKHSHYKKQIKMSVFMWSILALFACALLLVIGLLIFFKKKTTKKRAHTYKLNEMKSTELFFRETDCVRITKLA